MNLTIIDNVKKLLAFFKAPFKVESVPDILETVAKVLRDSLDIRSLLFRTPLQSTGQNLSDEELALEVENKLAEVEVSLVQSNPPATFDPAILLLVVELVKRLLRRDK